MRARLPGRWAVAGGSRGGLTPGTHRPPATFGTASLGLWNLANYRLIATENINITFHIINTIFP